MPHTLLLFFNVCNWVNRSTHYFCCCWTVARPVPRLFFSPQWLPDETELLKPLVAGYLSEAGASEYLMSGREDVLNPWDQQRLEVLRHALRRLIFPKFQIEMKKELKKHAQVCWVVRLVAAVANAMATFESLALHWNGNL